MQIPVYPLSAIAILLDFYARFVLLAKWGDRDAAGQQRKRALRRNWPKLSPTFMEVKDHIDQGGLLGLVPASLTSTALDVDRGDPVPLLANYIPWAVCHPSPRAACTSGTATPPPGRKPSGATPRAPPVAS